MELIVFDTGAGAHIFADYLRNHLGKTPIIEIIIGNNTHLGSKSPTEIVSITESTLKPYLKDSGNLIFLACNTATAYAIQYLRQKYPKITLIGTEPMLKTASSLIKSGTIFVLATPATIKSPRYQTLKSIYAKNLTTLEPNCSTWASLVDHNLFDQNTIHTTLRPYQNTPPRIILLACTHYLKYEDVFRQLYPDAAILSPLKPITHHIKTLLPSQ